MKNQFKSFKQLDDTELTQLWGSAVFVFDTNVLTNLYRYQTSTREELLKVMEQLSDRVWIPYHVALEYQRNRLTVIHGQFQKFEETKSAVKKAVSSLTIELDKLQLKKRHSHINPDTLIGGISSLTDEFFKELDNLETDSIQVSSKDDLLERLENLFEGKVGDKPDQKFITDLEADGKFRFDNFIPPGYKDAIKGNKNDDLFTYEGIEYHRQYGDLIVWKQLIEYSKSNDIKHIIFITDDNKEDWWQKTKGKTTGLRVELVNEIYHETNLDFFHAYNSESFLHNANIHLNENVSEDAIEEVKLITKDNILQSIQNIHHGYQASQEDVTHLIEQEELKFENQQEARRFLDQEALYSSTQQEDARRFMMQEGLKFKNQQEDARRFMMQEELKFKNQQEDTRRFMMQEELKFKNQEEARRFFEQEALNFSIQQEEARRLMDRRMGGLADDDIND